ncbi:MAG: Glycoside hydrolase 15-related protein, partial [Chloroflexi bacterium]
MDQGLYSKSVKLILENQSAWGSYVASPAFPTYQFCWLR